MSVLRALRLLILGETWALPGGVVAALVGAVAIRGLAPDLWQHAGGFALIAAVLVVLSVSVARAAGRHRS